MPEPYSFEAAGERFELVSRGDLVPGRLWLGAGSRPRPLVLVAPALGASKDASEVTALCREIAAVGMAAAAIDLPLQGERASTKLSARLVACAVEGARSGMDRLLWDEYTRQAALDLAAARAALARRREVEPARSACVAYEPGAAAAATWAASDAAVALCLRAARDAEPAGLVARLRLELAPR